LNDASARIETLQPVSLLGLNMPYLPGSILVVEDETFVREVTAEILKAAGYHVLKARNAVEAIRVFDERKDDIALLVADVVLPGRNGRDMAQELMHDHPTLKTIFISGYPDNPACRNHDLLHKTIYLPKPFSVDSLMQKVREVLVAS
jgi:two-component system, cell cycle sensor histidine kinase and response regulator CckA